jgi:CRISPR-associated protein Cas2
MPRRRWPALSPFRHMWTLVMFDLPMVTDEERRQYTHFRKFLLEEGYFRMQFSVYARHADSEERAKAFKRGVTAKLPPAGEVRMLLITDHQFGKMERFTGKNSRQAGEKPPEQLTFL